MSTYRYYTLFCDACDQALGWNSDPDHPALGITICADCWSRPADLPRHLKATISLDQAAVSTTNREKP